MLYHQQKEALSSPLGKAMGTQLFAAPNIAYIGMPTNFESDRLVDAFDIHDDQDQPSGFNFAIEPAICSSGLSGCKAGEARAQRLQRRTKGT